MSNNPDHAIAWIEKQGAVVCLDPEEKKRLAEYIAPVAVVFPDLVSRLVGVYPYSMKDQNVDWLSECDGISWEYHDKRTGSEKYVIGISVEGMAAGSEYAAFLFLHELAHTVTGCEHNTAFHDQLNSMIKTYNQATGANIANDLFGWPSRHDNRPYTPFARELPTKTTGSC